MITKFAWDLKYVNELYAYIFVDIDALVSILTVGEEFAFFCRMIVRARPILNLCAIREIFALSLLLFLISSCCLRLWLFLHTLWHYLRLYSDIILMFAKIYHGSLIHRFLYRLARISARMIRITFLESLKDISFLLLCLLFLLPLLSDQTFQILSFNLSRTLFQSAFNVSDTRRYCLWLRSSTLVESYNLFGLLASVLNGFLNKASTCSYI